MSVIITNGNMNLSTANGFYRVEAYNLGAYYNGALALSTARTIAVTFANSGNCQGLIISLSGTSTVTKSVTVKLQEYVGSTWTDRATVTKTRDEICNSVTNAFSYGGWIVPFVFSSPYAVTTAASTWRFEISEGSGTSDWSIRTSNGTNPFYVTWCDNALSFSDNDTVIIKDILYIDQTATFRGLLGTGETAISTCGVICRSTDPTPTGVSLLRWKKTPDTSYTLTLDGCIYFGAHSGFRVGSENVTVTMTIADPCVVTYTSHGLTDGEGVRFKTTGALPTGITAGTIYYVRSTDCSTPANEFWLYDSAAHAVAGGTTGRVATSGTQSGTHSVVWRIPIAQKAIIEFDTTPTYGTALCSGFQDGRGRTNTIGVPTLTCKQSLFMYGEYPTVQKTLLDGNASSGQPDIVTTDTTGWESGDEVVVGGGGGTYGENKIYTVSSSSGTTVTFTENLGANRIDGYPTWVMNKYGIILRANAASDCAIWLRNLSNMVFDGVEIKYVVMNNYYLAATSLDNTANLIKHSIKNCSIRTAGWLNFLSMGLYGNELGIEVDSCVCWSCGINYYCPVPYGPGYGYSGPVSMKNCRFCYLRTGSYIGNNAVIENNMWAGAGALTTLYLAGYNIEFNSNFIGSNTSVSPESSSGGIVISNALKVRGRNNTFKYNYFGIMIQNCADVIFTDTVFSNNTYDIATMPGMAFNVTFDGSSPTLSPRETYFENTSAISMVRKIDYDNRANDKGYTTYGSIHANTTSKFDATPNTTTTELQNNFLISSGAISGFKIGVFMSVQISNAAYYGGSTYVLPTLQVTYDVDQEVEDEASANTNLQQLACLFTPTIDNEKLYISQIQQSDDATASNRTVTWSGLIINIRKYGYSFSSTSKTLVDPSFESIGELNGLSASPYITEAVQATVDAYTGITINHATATLTITGAHTLKEIYDFTQSDLTADANMGYSEWFTTIDGVNYESAYDITVTDCALTGGGTVEMASGKTFTKSGTGSYNGIIIYADASREVHVLLNGLVAGSTVQIYDNDASSELYNDVVAGTSLDYIFTWTADHELRIRIRKAGYIPYEYTGDVVNTGMSLNISQENDDVYDANAIDGSTVTEFSLSGSTIMIYVDDPDNATTAQRMYNWYMYAISTTTYIGIQPNDVTAQTAWSYVLADEIQISNQDGSNPLFLTGANINNVSANGQVIDTSGGNININGYFPFNSAADVGTAIWTNSKALTVGKFLGLK